MPERFDERNLDGALTRPRKRVTPHGAVGRRFLAAWRGGGERASVVGSVPR